MFFTSYGTNSKWSEFQVFNPMLSLFINYLCLSECENVCIEGLTGMYVY